MTSAVLLEINAFIDVFDFDWQFNLAHGRMYISLKPSVITDTSGIKGVKAEIRHLYTKVFPEQYILYPPDLATPYAIPIPKINVTPVWGVYQAILTLVLKDGKEYKVSKAFNLCPPDAFNPYTDQLSSDMTMTVDCADGLLFVNDMVCRLYKGELPVKMEYNLTHWFPKESNINPIKNIQSLPYTAAAYNGLNRVSGYNDSYYLFEDNVSVVIRITGEVEKNIRCVPDYSSIYCGMRKLYDDLAECQATPDQYAEAFDEVNMLVWTITVGSQKGKDVSDDILRLEQLLGVSCVCHGCNGERVGPAPGCAAVLDVTATNFNKHLLVRWSNEGVPLGSSVRVSYRPLCETGNPEPYQDIIPDTINTGIIIQAVDQAVKYSGLYQVRVATIVDGRICDAQETDTGNYDSCPEILDINAVAVNK